MATIELNKGNFDERVIRAEKPVLVDFWAVWCGPCSMMSPIIEEIATEKADALVVGKVNCDENMELAQRYHITGIPAFLVFREGEVVERLVGAMPKTDLLAAVEKYL